jgi:hypothetical protein
MTLQLPPIVIWMKSFMFLANDTPMKELITCLAVVISLGSVHAAQPITAGPVFVIPVRAD